MKKLIFMSVFALFYLQTYIPFDPQLDAVTGLPQQQNNVEFGRVTFADGTLNPGRKSDHPYFFYIPAHRQQDGAVTLQGKNWSDIQNTLVEPWVTWDKEDALAQRMFRPFVFYDVMGVMEVTFQHLLHENPSFFPIMQVMMEEVKKQCKITGSFDHPTLQSLVGKIDKNYFSFFAGQKALLDSRFEQPTLDELYQEQEQNMTTMPLAQKPGSITLIDGAEIAKNQGELVALEQTDVRYIQENNPGALIQLASNFNCLEGGMGKRKSMLEHMEYQAVQGENAALGTMGAAIVRKYILQPINLLQGLENVTVDEDGRVTSITKTLTKNDVKKVRIGLHRNVMVTSGYYPPYSKNLKGNFSIDSKAITADAFITTTADRAIHKETTTYRNGVISRKKYLYDNAFVQKGRDPLFVFNGVVDKNKEIRIHQAITAALDLNPKHGGSIYDPESAKILLRAAYEGTILAAAHLILDNDAAFMKSRKIFLTFVGTGAFGNEVSWIFDVLKSQLITDLIAYYGLEVYLVRYYTFGIQPASSVLKNDIAEIDTKIEDAYKKFKSEK